MKSFEIKTPVADTGKTTAEVFDFCHNPVHRRAYLICQTVHNRREEMKWGWLKWNERTIIKWDFFGEKDIEFLSDDDNWMKVRSFIYCYGHHIVGEPVRRVYRGKNGIIVYVK